MPKTKDTKVTDVTEDGWVKVWTTSPREVLLSLQNIPIKELTKLAKEVQPRPDIKPVDIPMLLLTTQLLSMKLLPKNQSGMNWKLIFSVAINAGGIWFQLYTKGIFSKACKGGVDDLNHGVLAAGYTPEYYNVKNSWGSSWGEAGYIRFAILSTPEGQCGIH